MKPTFGGPRRKRGCLVPFLLLLVIAGCGWLIWTPFLTVCGQFLVEDDGPRKADAIVVLGGDRYGDRTVKGAELAKEGYAPVVYVSGPPRLMGYESSDEVLFAQQKGYPASLFQEVHLPGEAESSLTECQFIGKYLAGRGAKSILLVTSNFHTKRAAKLWRRENPKLTVTVVPSQDPFFTPNGWWKNRPARKTFLFEWLKTIAADLGI